jgi:plastocyanin
MISMRANERSPLRLPARPGLGLALIAALGLLLIVAGCAGSSSANAGVITVKGSEYKFDPATVTVEHGQKVTLTFENVGTTTHDWQADGVSGAATGPVQPKQQKTITFTAPAAGTYKVECTEPGHAEAGMVGQLVVK